MKVRRAKLGEGGEKVALETFRSDPRVKVPTGKAKAGRRERVLRDREQYTGDRGHEA